MLVYAEYFTSLLLTFWSLGQRRWSRALITIIDYKCSYKSNKLSQLIQKCVFCIYIKVNEQITKVETNMTMQNVGIKRVHNQIIDKHKHQDPTHCFASWRSDVQGLNTIIFSHYTRFLSSLFSHGECRRRRRGCEDLVLYDSNSKYCSCTYSSCSSDRRNEHWYTCMPLQELLDSTAHVVQLRCGKCARHPF